ncbi:TapB family protein [Geotalea uraniireducens]|uniref:DUF3108 domain-containing protein n=1 Tax=Geotalea uraniireducens (strain Rf4) TaxID=351605 RepID=A5G552_GEOUR|nr:hypothetical protein [Geotalea uraniireducens]ABQ26920.1 hypothetical protein Gura_2746 [Geotalea uraniireducens Rf4]
MRTKLVLLVLLTLFISACGSGGGTPGITGGSTNDNTGGNVTVSAGEKGSYFPLTAGSTWTYRKADQAAVTKLVTNDGRVRTNVGSEPPKYSTYTISNNSIVLTLETVSGVINANQVEFTSKYDVSSIGLLVFPSNTTVGNVETSNYTLLVGIDGGGTPVGKTTTLTVVGTETVQVAAGSFNAIKIQETNIVGSVASLPAYSWYAAGVGLVKNGDMELVSYSIK